MATVIVLTTALTYAGLSTSLTDVSTWNWLDPQPQGNQINAMSFPATDTGWAVGRSGVVLQTTDGGANWTFQRNGSASDPGVYRDWNAVSFPTTSTGWIVGTQGTAKKTNDAGSTWTTVSVSAPSASVLRGVASRSTTAAIIVGEAAGGSALIRYTINGTAWSSGTTTMTNDLHAVAFNSAGTAWAVGPAGMMVSSTDGGASWTARGALTAQALNGVAFATDAGVGLGYAVGNASGAAWTVLKTTDGGATWTAITTPGGITAQNLLAVACDRTGNRIVAVGANGAVFRSDDAGVTWVSRDPGRFATSTLRAAAFPASTRVQAGGDFGYLPYSRDGGLTWFAERQKSTVHLNDTSWTSQTAGWAVGNGGVLMRTIDGGLNWSGKNIGTTANLMGVAFPTVTTGYVTGSGGLVWKTTDGGASWTVQSSGTTQTLNEITFVNATTGYLVGDAGTIRYTTNGGTTWVAATSGTTQNLYSVDSGTNANNVWVCGGNGTVLRTTNGGTTWTSYPTGAAVALRGISGPNSNSRVMAVGDGGAAYTTADGGTTWTNIGTALGTTENLLDVSMASNTAALVVGTHGTVAYTANTGTSWTMRASGVPTASADGPVEITSIQFLTTSVARFVGSEGETRYSSDAGVTWGHAYYGSMSDLAGLSTIGTSTAWAVGANGMILNSFDHGETWYQQNSNAAQNLNAVKFLSASTGYAVGAAGTIRLTTDGGWNWASQTTTVTTALNALDATGTHAIATGAAGKIIFTSTSGGTWTAAGTVPTTQTIYGVSMISTSTAWAVAQAAGPATSARIMKTVDGGTTWTTEVTGTPDLRAVCMRPDGTHGWAVGMGGVIYSYVATSGPGVWTPQASGTTANLYAVSFTSDATGWATGAAGTVLRTQNGGATWTSIDVGTDSRDLLAAVMFGDYGGHAVGSGGTIFEAQDFSVPVTTLLASPGAPDGQSGWYVTTPTILLQPDEPAVTSYSWDSASGPYSVYGAALTPASGTSTLYYFSTGENGHKEATQSAPFKLDTQAPTAPASLATVSVPGTSSVELSWTGSSDAVSGVSLYRIYVDGAYWASAAGTTATVTGLTPYQTYSMTVYAVDVAGNLSAVSNALPVTMFGQSSDALITNLQMYPAAPSGLAGWYSSATTFTLTSQPSTVAADICYAWDTTASAVATYSYNGSTNPTSPAYPAINGTHVLWYWSVDPGAVRPVAYYSTTVSVDPTIPNQPGSFVASATGDTTVRLTWSEPVENTSSGIHEYLVFVDGAEVAALTTGTTTYDVIGLSPLTSYTFSIKAASIAGNVSAASTAVTSTLPPTKPSPPSIVYAHGTSGRTVYVDWLPSVDAQAPTSYVIYRDDTAIATVTLPIYQFTYVDTGLYASTAYRYSVVTVDPRGASETSVSYTATTSAPVRPRGVATSVSTSGPGPIMISWLPVPNLGIVRYHVYRSRVSLALPATSTTGPSVMTTVGSADVPFTFYIDGTTEPGYVYYYRVAAEDAAGNIGRKSVEATGSLKFFAAADARPHGDAVTSDSCAGCHRGHIAASPKGVVTPGEATPSVWVTPTVSTGVDTWNNQRLCLDCHNGVVADDIGIQLADPLTAPPLGSRHGSVTATQTGSIVCGSCHASHRSLPPISNPYRLNVNGVTTGNQYCYTCHGPGTPIVGGDISYFETGAHNLMPQNSAVGIKCQVCHTALSSTNPKLTRYADSMLCMQCHSGADDNPDFPDILALLDASDDAHARHPITIPDQQATGARVSCQNCHNPMRITTANKLSDPDDPYNTLWSGDSNAFCEACHDGALPTAAQTYPYSPPLGSGGTTISMDIRSAYVQNTHGSGTTTVGVDPKLRPEMGYATGEQLPCSTCHQWHGTLNTYMLSQAVRSRSGTIQKTGLLVYRFPGGGADFRFFCNACHVLPGHASKAAFPKNCMGAGCHQHTMQPAGPHPGDPTNTTF